MNALDGLGRLLKNEKYYPEAEKADREVLESRGRVLGAEEAVSGSSACGLPCVVTLVGKPDESLANLKSAVEHALPAETRPGLEKDTDLKSLHALRRCWYPHASLPPTVI